MSGRSPAAGRARACAAAAALALPLVAAVPAAAEVAPAPVSTSLSRLLPALPGDLTVLVHATSATAAESAVRRAGLARVTAFPRVGVVVARGSAARVQAVRTQPGVDYVEADDPIRFTAGSSGTTATGSRAARQTLTGADGRALDGRGVTVAVIDTGIDPNHPAFRGEDGATRVVRNLKSACLGESTATSCVLDLPTSVDTDTLSVGGHGTHVAGIAAGRPHTLADGTAAGGSAPRSTGCWRTTAPPAARASRPPPARRSRWSTTPTAPAAAASSTRGRPR